MPIIGGIDFVFLRGYEPPDIPVADLFMKDFFEQIKSSMGQPGPSSKVIVTINIINLMRTTGKMLVEATFRCLIGDQMFVTSEIFKETHISESFKDLGEFLKEFLGS